MYQRLLELPESHSYFLFGARNTGKSTLVNLLHPESSFRIDLLNREDEERYSRNPDELYHVVKQLPDATSHVVIDEVQKVPKLLDVVQRLMMETKKYFGMTGSSARKLKRGGANLLAGRAFVYHLFPLSFMELGADFDLDHALRWGSLPQIFKCHSDDARQDFLNTYAHTYLREEINAEQLVRQLEPFRRFLEVAAQCNGKIINFANIARDVGVDDKTIKSYYSILEDTLIGFFLEPFHHSLRKRLSQKPKFYFFDPGVVRALARLTSVPLMSHTSGYGDAFEHFVILECYRLADYFRKDFRFSYLQTPAELEIDLVIERPGKPLLCIEIKSSNYIRPQDLRGFIHLTKDMPDCEAVCLCNDKYAKKIDHVTVLPWREGIKEYFAE